MRTQFAPVPALLVLSLLGFLAGTSSARAQCSTDLTCQFNGCRTPATGVPSQLWGDLRPTDTGIVPSERDNTDYPDGQPGAPQPGASNPLWISLDIENGWIFTAISHGLQIWDARTTPTQPVRFASIGQSNFPSWPADPHEGLPVRDLDAPPGNDSVLAVALAGEGGLVVFHTTNKAMPVGRYVDDAKTVLQVHAGRTNGNDFAFSATNGQGLLVHNLTRAASLTGTCTDVSPGSTGCGVYVRKLGSRLNFAYIDGVGNAAGTKYWIAASSGGNAFGLQIWDVSNPLNGATQVMEAFATSPGADFIHGVAMWRAGSSIYLGLRTQTQFRIYNMSCLETGTCGSTLGTAIATINITGDFDNNLLTFSESGARRLVYLGNFNRCSTLTQNEWLYDVTSAASPIEMTPPDGVVGGIPTGYWGWYYRRTASGFNNVAPRMGKFNGTYFYRAAYSLFDIHQLVGGGAPTASFQYTPNPVYLGQQIDFSDTSSGPPTSWSWTFQNGTPATSTQQSPQNVVFNSLGTKQVCLTATNAFGSNQHCENVTVLDPAAQVGTVTAGPTALLLCQSVTFTANGLAGSPTPTLSWEVRDGQNQLVTTGGNVNPFVWSTASAAAGTFTATVTASNTAGTDTATSPVVTVNALPALAFTSPNGAPETLNGPPFGSGLVQFRIQTQGATEWRWDFGDGTTPVWTSDPVSGPAPMHTYAVEGQYTVTVDIRNCVTGPATSASTTLDIPNTTPLVAEFNATGLFCTGSGCFADANQPISFADTSQGTPSFWDYDWDGNGSYEDADHTTPVTSHTYTSAGSFQPVLRVRRGLTTEDTDQHTPIIVGVPPASVSLVGPELIEIATETVYTATANNCSAPTSWTWDVGAGGTIVGSDTGASITVTYASPDVRTISATANSGGCNTLSDTLDVDVVVANDPLFSDGFEAGDTTGWSLVVP